MTNKAKIKVIKKKDIQSAKKVEDTKKKNKQEVARQMVSNVSNWVNDFQKRKRVETKKAFEQLFPTQPQTESL